MTEDTEYQSYTRPPEDVRMRRDRRIRATDWMVLRHREQLDSEMPTSLTSEQYDALLLYRQSLRDVPLQAEFPENVEWPQEPDL